MGFNVVALAQKARTQTLIVDSDLNMGNYDLIATDVKGDTAEFSEFVGGVGNFESGLISGGLDVGDILHAESSMQIDGDLVVEGAINNVNITNEGAISTAKSVTATGGFKGNLQGNVTGNVTGALTGNVNGNVTGSISGGTVAGSTGTFSGAVTGASFNSVPIKKVITVTPNNTHPAVSQSLLWNNEFVCILPRLNGVVYNGSVRVYGFSGTYLWYITSMVGSRGEYTLPVNNYLNIPLSNAECLYIKPQVNNGASLCGFTLS